MMTRSMAAALMITIALCALSCAQRSAHSEVPEVGPPQVLHRLSGLEACSFTGPETPGGTALIVSRLNQASFSWELLRVPLDGAEPEIIGFGRDPDARGSMLAWIGTEPGHEGIWLRDLAADEGPVRLTESLEMFNPSIASDGERVACTRRTAQRDGIFVLAPGARRPVTVTNRDERDPAWGPREDLMLAIKTDQLWLFHATRWEQMEQTRLTDGGMVHFDPTWGPDEHWGAFAAGWTERQARIGLMHLPTREITWVAPGITGARSPAISPDGRFLAFVAGEGEASALYLCDLRLPEAADDG